jgi:8-oxo-dGTP pyrophosphatase MutT (NUDIX family)
VVAVAKDRIVAALSASTVVVLRDGVGGLEAYLQRRPRTMGFAGGLWAFPGGRVDAADRDPSVDALWTGPPPSQWAERLGVPVADARGLVVAACREAFEEAGLLLAERPAEPAAAAAARRDLLAGRRAFAAALAGLGQRLDTARLRYWAWWVTPEAEPRRYDTRFFIAALPEGAAVSAHGLAEVDRDRWLSPGKAAADQSMLMLPPTRFTLRDLAGFRTAREALSAADGRSIERIMPWLEGDVLVMPWNERYPVPVAPAGTRKATRARPPPGGDLPPCGASPEADASPGGDPASGGDP